MWSIMRLGEDKVTMDFAFFAIAFNIKWPTFTGTWV